MKKRIFIRNNVNGVSIAVNETNKKETDTMEIDNEFKKVLHGDTETMYSGFWTKKDTYQQAILEILENNEIENNETMELTDKSIYKQEKRITARFRMQANHRQLTAMFNEYRIDDKLIADIETSEAYDDTIDTMYQEIKVNKPKYAKTFKLYHVNGYTLKEIAKKLDSTKRKIEYALGNCYEYLSINSSLADLSNSRFVFGIQNKRRNFPKWEQVYDTEPIDNVPININEYQEQVKVKNGICDMSIEQLPMVDKEIEPIKILKIKKKQTVKNLKGIVTMIFKNGKQKILLPVMSAKN